MSINVQEKVKMKVYSAFRYIGGSQMSYGWSSDELGTTGSKRTKMSHHNISITSWDINDSLAADFDGSLSGLGNDLGSGTYNMRYFLTIH